MKKTRRWLDANDVEYEFHDYKKLGITAGTLEIWCDDHGFEALINKRGTTWRKLDDADKENLDQKKAIALCFGITSNCQEIHANASVRLLDRSMILLKNWSVIIHSDQLFWLD